MTPKPEAAKSFHVEEQPRFFWNYANPELAKSVRAKFQANLGQYPGVSTEPFSDNEIEEAAMELFIPRTTTEPVTPEEYFKNKDKQWDIIAKIVERRRERQAAKDAVEALPLKKAKFVDTFDRGLAWLSLSEKEVAWKYADKENAEKVRKTATKFFPTLSPPPTDQEIEDGAYAMYGAPGAPYRETPGGMKELWPRQDFLMAIAAHVLQKRLGQ